ncbi:CubicO group peptidase (beta-lactamase class C family) [Paenibacillus turicensis]|uniref:CubicO group peptidase (Beta-lactamase class C family) n=1 Tax=Paenibacillus turicensis TaxID=160487 RepID=A0ABS4FY90_9BACL|nr:serine hydrolase domain-containing protein [Paenibacillus turicensis]MBP1907538.1 CubicO group peptidase (beta-lactamase class C family) [Paenibacillus turicensis]
MNRLFYSKGGFETETTKHLLAQYVKDYIARWDFSGVIYIVKEGEVLLETASGMACYEFEVPNTINTNFSLASITKQFTAFAIMQLWDQGKLDLHSSANNYLPPNLAIDSRITIHHLLSHSSGLSQSYNFEEDFFGVYNRNTYVKQQYFDEFIDRPLAFEPGCKYEYNNAGYNVLAWIVEYVSGQSFDQYLDGNIFKPLGMTNTYVDTGTNVIKNRAFPYEYEWTGVVKAQYSNERFSIGAAGIVSNCQDLYKWNQCLLQQKLLSHQGYEFYLGENLNGYCYGLEKQQFHHHLCYAHGGDFIGVMTYMLHGFDDDLSIIILSNTSFGNQYKMASALCDLIFTGSTEKPLEHKEVSLTEEEIATYEGVYIEGKLELRHSNGKWSLNRFNNELQIPIIPIGNHQFLRIDCDQRTPYTLEQAADGKMSLWGYTKK